MSDTYLILSNADRSEVGFTTLKAHSRKPQCDTTGRQMMILKEFQASSWEEAKKVYRKFFGF